MPIGRLSIYTILPPRCRFVFVLNSLLIWGLGGSRETDDRIGFFLTDNAGVFVAGMVHLGWVDEQPAAYDAFNSITPLAVAIPPTNGTMLSVAQAANTPGIAK